VDAMSCAIAMGERLSTVRPPPAMCTDFSIWTADSRDRFPVPTSENLNVMTPFQFYGLYPAPAESGADRSDGRKRRIQTSKTSDTPFPNVRRKNERDIVRGSLKVTGDPRPGACS